MQPDILRIQGIWLELSMLITVLVVVPPALLLGSLLYSLEFFELARDSLKAGGYYVLWAPTQRAVDTFTKVFPHVIHLRPASVMSAA